MTQTPASLLPKNSSMHILRTIYQHGQITRAELSQLLDLSPTTIVRLVAELREQNWLIEVREVNPNNGRGRPSDMLRIHPECGYSVGMDFGGDQLLVVITNAVGELVYSEVHPAPEFVASPQTMDALVEIAQHTTAAYGLDWSQIRAFGLALHDLVSADGQWIAWTSVSGVPFPARDYLREKLGMTIHIEDVSRAFAEAEHRNGAGRGIPDLLYMFIGSRGIGSGIFVNDTLLKSASGICGEIGHIVVDPDGVLCQCGNKGCLVKVAVANVVVDKFIDLLRQGAISSLNVNNPITLADIGRAAESGDKAAYLIVQQAAVAIAKALVSSINILGTPSIIIGGEFSFAGTIFLNDLSSLVRQQVIPALTNKILIRYAELDQSAGAWGCALQALDAAWNTASFYQL